VHSDFVNDVSYAGLAMRGDILGLKRRRRWGEEEKLGTVLSVGVGGATVTPEYATIIIETAKLNGVDPQTHLAELLARIHYHIMNRIHELLPWNWSPLHNVTWSVCQTHDFTAAEVRADKHL
jgi:hypothetical protein